MSYSDSIANNNAIGKPANQPNNRLTDQPNQPTNQPTNQPIQLTNQFLSDALLLRSTAVHHLKGRQVLLLGEQVSLTEENIIRLEEGNLTPQYKQYSC